MRAGPAVSAVTVLAVVQAARRRSARVAALLRPTEFACRGAGEAGVFTGEPLLRLCSELDVFSRAALVTNPRLCHF